jgi:hypothetical protein
LEVQLHGYTRPSLYYADHYIDVLILDRNGQPIHEKYWRRGFRTAGNMIPGWPGVENKTWSIDVSAFDLGRAYRLHVVVGYY